MIYKRRISITVISKDLGVLLEMMMRINERLITDFSSDVTISMSTTEEEDDC